VIALIASVTPGIFGSAVAAAIASRLDSEAAFNAAPQ
jgi:hypothetical protein